MSTVWSYAPSLLEGIGITVLVTVLGCVLTVIVAFAAGLARMSTHRILRWPGGVFVEFFRGSSMLVQLFWLFYALPFFGIQLAPITAAVIALGCNEGAYAAEIVRGTIKSRPKGQTEAAIALGMSPALRMRRILIPQSLPAMLPNFGNVFVDLLKNSCLVSLVTVGDLTFRAQQARITTGETAELFLTILVIYFVLSLVLALLMAWLERRFALNVRERPKMHPLKAILGGRVAP